LKPHRGRTLGAWLEAFMESRASLKPESRRKLEQTKAKLIEFFGEDQSLHGITPDRASRWRESLKTKGLSEAAVKTHVGNAKTMLAEIFGPTLPNVVTPAFASTFVLMIRVFNMVGRFFWSSLSDYWGRKLTYAVYFCLGIPLYLSIPFWANRQSVNPSLVWLIGFYAATMVIFTLYGGGFATIPAYLADLFGSKFVGGIHGRLLTAWSTAGVIGPWLITTLREHSLRRAIRNLVEHVDPAQFSEKFGASVSQLDALVAAKTVTLPKLMEIAPSGIVDPSATLYNSTMFVMAALLAIALLANALIRPVGTRERWRAG
jgi:MFS family permease